MIRRRWALRGLGAAAVAVGLGLLFQAPIREAILRTWYLHKLESGTPREKQDAAFRLARMHAVQAIPVLVRIGKEAGEEGLANWVVQALIRIGPSGEEAAVRSFREEDGTLYPAILNGIRDMKEEGLAAALRLEDPRSLWILQDRFGEQEVPLLLWALKAGNAQARVKAANAIGRMWNPSEPVVRALLGALKDPVASVRLEAICALERLHSLDGSAIPELLGALTGGDEETRNSIMGALGWLGSAARAGIPVLLGAIEDGSLSETPGMALEAIEPDGATVVPRLLIILRSGSPAGRRAAAQALGRFAENSSIVLPAIIAALSDPISAVRKEAASVLKGIDSGAEAVVPRLLSSLRDPDPDVAYAAAEALAARKERPEVTVPFLVESLRSQVDDRRFGAAVALGEYGTMARQAIAPLLRALDDPNDDVRRTAFDALSRMKGELALHAAEIAGKVVSRNAWVRWKSLLLLADVGEAASPFVPLLIACLKDHDTAVNESAIKALASIGPAASAAARDLLGLCADPMFQKEALAALQKLGQKSAPALLEGLKDANPKVRAGSLVFLPGIGPPDVDPLLAITAGLKDDDALVRESAIDALRSLCGKLDRLVILQTLQALLDDAVGAVRLSAAMTMQSAGCRTEAILPVLVRALTSESAEERRQAAMALGNGGSDSAPAVPALIRLLEQESLEWTDDGALRQAIDALGMIGSAASRAIPVLEDLRGLCGSAYLRSRIDRTLSMVKGETSSP